MGRMVVSNAKGSCGRRLSGDQKRLLPANVGMSGLAFQTLLIQLATFTGVQHASRGHQAATYCPGRLRQGSLIGRGREVLEYKSRSSGHSYVHRARTQAASGDLSAAVGKQETTSAIGNSPGDAQVSKISHESLQVAKQVCVKICTHCTTVTFGYVQLMKFTFCTVEACW